jgi:RNA ligase
MNRLHIFDLLDPSALADAIAEGYVRERAHPNADLWILNYAEKAAYERNWTDVTRTCRGLIINGDGHVVARPWGKFFNYGEHERDGMPALDLTTRVDVTDKMDGSLGILYPLLDTYMIATRGSFSSDQAYHATQIYLSRYADFEPDPDLTYLFEIVYPGNRIVLDYGDTDDLVLLGAVETETGMTYGPLDERLESWPGPRTASYDYLTLADALAAEPRPNAEGLVVRYVDGSGLMVKIKQEDYVRLHKLITGLSERAVWEHLSAGLPLGDLLASIPDEFHDWVIDKGTNLSLAHQTVLGAAEIAYIHLVDELCGTGVVAVEWTRKDFAMEAQKYGDLRPYLFNLLDGKNPSAAIWKSLRPVGETYMFNASEDTA